MQNSETNKAIIAACVVYANSIDSSHDVCDILKLMRIIAELDNQLKAFHNPCKDITVPYTSYECTEPEDHKEYVAKDKDRFNKPLAQKVITKYGR